MKMNYLRRSDRSRKKVVFLVGALILIIILFLLSSQINSFSSKVLQEIAFPFWKTKVFITDKSYILKAFLSSRLNLVEENKNLKNSIEKNKIKLIERDLLLEENKNLKTALGRNQEESNLPGLVLAKPPQTIYDVLIIDLGERDGIQVGEKVFFENIILGEIIEVSRMTSKVRLYSGGNMETDALIGRLNLPVKVLGRGNGNFEIRLPQDLSVEVGDFVLASQGSNILGQIEEIEEISTSAFKRIFFRFPLNLSELRWISVQKADN